MRVTLVNLLAAALAAAAALLLAGDSPAVRPINDNNRLPAEAARLHAYVTQPFGPGELAYRQIPWLVDLDEGVRVARTENRPLLLWTSGDDPLDRC